MTTELDAQHLTNRVATARGPRYADYLDGLDSLDSGVDVPGGDEAPILDVRDETGPFGIRLVCALAAGADREDARRWMRSVWPVTIEVDCRLPASMRRLLAAWERGDGSGLAALRELL